MARRAIQVAWTYPGVLVQRSYYRLLRRILTLYPLRRKPRLHSARHPPADLASCQGGKHRVFLVGCPRSGTTLLQAMLAAHPEVASFPETHFFRSMVGMAGYRQFGEAPQGLRDRWRLLRGRLRCRLGLARRGGRKTLERFLIETGNEDMLASLGPWHATMKDAVAEFLHVLDELALKQGKRLWVDKTPPNIHYIDVIERYVPQAKFVHIVREGANNVASIYDAAQKYDEPWGRQYPTVDRCVTRWLICARETLKYAPKKNHLVVRYEELVEAPGAALTRVCELMGIGFDEAMLKDYGKAVAGLVLERELWKASVAGPIRNTGSDKFHRLFDEAQKLQILDRVGKIDLERLGSCRRGQ